MTNSNIYSNIINKQNTFFNSNVTKDVQFRKETLKKLLHVIINNEDLICEALYKDLKKSKLETIATETALIKSEIKQALQNLDNWARKERVPTVLANIPAKSYIISEPLGTVLIMGAWNYPFIETLQPLASAIAAGNTVIIKPSELAIHSSSLITKLINENFTPEIIYSIEGGIPETSEILKLKFDKIFFTGSSTVGKIVYKAAAEHLTPITLELGGKSPAIICSDASVKIAAKRIVWGKFLNSGQTCIAPDYLLIDKKLKATLVKELIKQIQQIYGEDPSKSEALTQIINEKHFNRLSNLIDKDKVIWGGTSNKQQLFIAPTLLDNINWNEPIMQEEIFGPLLPIIEFQNLNEAIKEIKSRPKPLALYLFTNSKKTKNKVLNEVSFGSGAINETVVQLSNHHLPFGGVGNSGTGNYHGKFGFDTFSHKKGIHEKSNWFEPSLKYPPFNNLKTKLINWILS